MNDDAVSAGAIITFVLLFALWAFTPVTDGVAPADYNRAIAACEQHQGVKFVERPSYVSQRFTAKCKNGVEVEMTAQWYKDNGSR